MFALMLASHAARCHDAATVYAIILPLRRHAFDAALMFSRHYFAAAACLSAIAYLRCDSFFDFSLFFAFDC